jgi:hypothetical protein
MAKTLLLAWASPKDEASDAEFNAWYNGTHIPQMRAAIPSITAVHRYRTAALPGVAGAQPPQRYLAVYEMDADDVAAMLRAMADAPLDITTTMDTTAAPPMLQWYQAAE